MFWIKNTKSFQCNVSDRWIQAAAGMSKQECETNKKWILDLDSHFSEWSWHKSRVCIKIAACQSMQKEKSILHHHIKHEASSKLAYSHTQHHITHMLFRFYINIYNLPDTSKKKKVFSHVLPEDKPHALWIQTYVTLFAEPHQFSGTIYTSKFCRVGGNITER